MLAAEKGPADSRRGLLLGLVAVIIFALSLPMTRVAVGDASSPELSPAFVTALRAALAGALSILYLFAVKAPRPPRELWGSLGVSGMGTVVGFPVFLAFALRDVHSMHAAVVTGVLPLATAVCGALYFRQRPSVWFWVCAVSGCALILTFAVQQGGGALVAGDWLLLGAVMSAAVGYIAGARASSQMPAAHVICWILAVTFAPAAALAWWLWPAGSASWQAWGAVVYLGAFPMWLGFFAWYRGMVLGGAVRVSQVQLVQPFLALLFAVPIAGETLQPSTIAYSLAVILIVYLGKKTQIRG